MRKTILAATAISILLASLCAHADTRSIMSAPSTRSAPKIDGQVSPGEWPNAGASSGFHEYLSPYPAACQTVIRLCYDDQSLYCRFDCKGEARSELAGSRIDRDGPIWNDSSVEVFLAPPSWPLDKYIHLVVNHAGAMMDEMAQGGDRDAGWNGEWTAAAGTTDSGYVVEIAIPWATLGTKPEAGAELRANFSRTAPSRKQISTWTPMTGWFHSPSEFGSVRLVGESPAVDASSFPDREFAPRRFDARLTSPAKADAASFELSTVPASSGKTAPFAQGSDGIPSVELTVSPTYGLRLMTATVLDRDRRPLWRHTLTMNVPDIPTRLRELKRSVEDTERRSEPLGKVARSRFAALESRSRTASDLQSILRIADDVVGVSARLSDLRALAVSSGNRSFLVTNPSPTLKIQQDAPDAGPAVEFIRMAMAKREFETSQIVITAVTRAMSNVNVSTGDLKGPSGASIPASRVVVNPTGYVTCKVRTPGAPLQGDVPEVLLPNHPMSIAEGRRLPFYITVRTTGDDRPGEYTGRVRITADGQGPVEIPLTVRVYNVTLPVKSHMRTAFVLWDDHLKRFADDPKPAFLDTYIKYSKFMLDYRISPITFWSLDDQGETYANTKRYLQETVPYGLTTFNIGGNGALASDYKPAYATAMKKLLTDNGWWDLQYVYGFDEAGSGSIGSMLEKYKVATDAIPDLKIMQTGWNPDPRLKDLVKIWCPLTSNADIDKCRAAEKNGDETWWYVCCGPTAPYANLFVDYPGIDHRILGWMTYSNKVQGLLYWGVNVWPNEPGVAKYADADYANWNPNSFGEFNGDGYLLYPGKGNTPIASVRLALLRDGIEDYDLFTELESLAKKHPEAAGKVADLLDFHRTIIRSLTSYTHNGDDLLRRREAILQCAETLAGGSGH